ncbi:MAG: hypothetical protein CMA63_02615 [Euryarchaeota archaeon]|nr:hypothetical protein [Euryarchaeota archaeon]
MVSLILIGVQVLQLEQLHLAVKILEDIQLLLMVVLVALLIAVAIYILLILRGVFTIQMKAIRFFTYLIQVEHQQAMQVGLQ